MAAATVDHGLRPESAGEAAFVGRICSELEVSHKTLKVQVKPGNIQAEARSSRYAALADWAQDEGLVALATAHHADDQAETLLARLNRGSGVGGLAGVRARGQVPATPIPLLRPLLGWRRSELAVKVAQAGLKAIEDASNLDDRFDRVRIRKALADADWIDVPMLALSAANLADADAALDWAAAREWNEAVSRTPMGMTYRPRAPKAVALRVLTRIIPELDGEAPRGSAVARLFDSLLSRQPASIGSLVARAMPDGWSFSRAPVRRA